MSNEINTEIKWFITEKHKEQNKAFQIMKESGLIRPGTVIEGALLEEWLGRKYNPRDSWDFVGEYIVLKNLIEAEGYFCTQKKMDPPGFRILDTHEMVNYAKHKLIKNCLSNYKIGYVLSSHTEKKNLSEEQQNEMMILQKTAARTALSQQSDLLRSFAV